MNLNDVAKGLRISKKTIYKYFDSKEDLLLKVINECFDSVHEAQRVIYESSLGTREKLIAILTAETKYDMDISFEMGYEFEKMYPALYGRIVENYESEWGYVLELLERGKREGIFGDVCVELVRKLLSHGMEMMHEDDFLIRNGLKYKQAIRQMVDIVIGGISK